MYSKYHLLFLILFETKGYCDLRKQKRTAKAVRLKTNTKPTRKAIPRTAAKKGGHKALPCGLFTVYVLLTHQKFA